MTKAGKATIASALASHSALSQKIFDPRFGLNNSLKYARVQIVWLAKYQAKVPEPCVSRRLHAYKNTPDEITIEIIKGDK